MIELEPNLIQLIIIHQGHLKKVTLKTEPTSLGCNEDDQSQSSSCVGSSSIQHFRKRLHSVKPRGLAGSVHCARSAGRSPGDDVTNGRPLIVFPRKTFRSVLRNSTYCLNNQSIINSSIQSDQPEWICNKLNIKSVEIAATVVNAGASRT